MRPRGPFALVPLPLAAHCGTGRAQEAAGFLEAVEKLPGVVDTHAQLLRAGGEAGRAVAVVDAAIEYVARVHFFFGRSWPVHWTGHVDGD